MLFFFTIFLSITANFAHAHIPQDGDVYLSALPTLIIPRPGHYAGLNYPVQGAVSLIAEGDLDTHGGIEIGIIYMPYFSSVTWNEQTVTEKVQRLYISSGYRYWFNKHYSVQLGFFAAYSMGEPQTIQNDYTVDPPDTSASDSTEYGFDASFQLEPLHFGKRFSLIVEARYAHSVTQKPREDEDFMSCSVGLKFFLQSREEEIRK